jgi:hypothetical protein
MMRMYDLFQRNARYLFVSERVPTPVREKYFEVASFEEVLLSCD